MSSSHLAAPSPWLAQLRRYRFWLIGCVTAIALFLPSFSTSVQAQAAYPPLHDPYVNDYGEVLAADDKAHMRTELEAFRAQTSIHAVVMTIQSIHDYATGDTSIESFATNTFNTWELGDATRNDGILLLVAPGDREVRIELGRGYNRQDDQIAQAIIDDAMLPFFRENQISLGTVAGTSAIIDQFDPSRPRPHPVASLINNVSLPSSRESGIAVLATLAAGGGVATRYWRKWRRHRGRDCPKCQVAMRRLAEDEDDEFLRAGQRQEEALKSVDYDVWLCPDCGYHTVAPYSSHFSGYSKCTACHYKTLSTSSETIRSATYTSTGQARITETCHHCDHSHSYLRTLPRLEETTSSSSSSSNSSSSSGSSGSSGGGSSSGGGASGSW